ncbi:MAG TPA: hypothetical protein VJV75_10990, partial [Candidatus Polarisedimenticolia bacterium]|nr:hypothetical protein [Candidatus Polarisedimenticolia bacterium]
AALPATREAPAPVGSSDATTTPVPAPAPVPAPNPAPEAERPLVVIYFDFGQMRPDGRQDAVAGALRWVDTIKAPGERVMIAGYVTRRGIFTITEPTSDIARLHAGLDDAEHNLDYADLYALALPERIDECLNRDRSTCPIHALTEYEHGRRSLEGFQRFLMLLAQRPGPKTVLYFHENGMMAPGPIYLQSPRQSHYTLTESVGAEATTAHAAVYPMLTGMIPPLGVMGDQMINLQATLAESTGGAYSRDTRDTDRLLGTVGRGCRCRYVLAFKPVDDASHRVASVSVTARGVRLPALYRVRPLSAEDRWLRQASAVLEEPRTAHDLVVGAALRPVRAGERRWDLSAEVAFEARSLALLPHGPAREGGWEVGARLQRLDGLGTWEMLATSSAVTGAAGPPDAVLLNAQPFTGLSPGRYHLSAFVRDRTANLFGGAEALVDLPDPARGGVSGPLLLSGREQRVVSPLPLLTRNQAVGGVAGRQDAGPTPLPDGPVPRGTLLRFESWICGVRRTDTAATTAPSTTAEISRDDAIVLRLEPETPKSPAAAEGSAAPATATAGACGVRVDEVATGGLEPGSYLYVLRVRTGAAAPVIYPVPFVIAAAGTAPGPAPAAR